MNKYQNIKQYNSSREKFGFYSMHKYLWETMPQLIDNIEYNGGLHRINTFEINEDLSLKEIKAILKKAKKPLEITSIKTKEEALQELKIKIEEDGIQKKDFKRAFEDYYEDSDDILEQLGLHTTYFEPEIFDEKTAYECGLMPFQYSGYEIGMVNLLALNGCGMDLSPRLDAYQALVSNTIDRDSRLFTDKNYFEYVVGKEVTQDVIEAISLEGSI